MITEDVEEMEPAFILPNNQLINKCLDQTPSSALQRFLTCVLSSVVIFHQIDAVFLQTTREYML